MGCCCGKEKPTDFDPRNKGPIKNRSCTDILCLPIFFIVIIAYVIVGIFAWLNGDPIILISPTDNQGRLCGVKYGDFDLSSRSNLFYFDMTECARPGFTVGLQCQTKQVCVESCPTEAWTYLVDITKLSGGESVTDWSKYICEYGYNVETEFTKSTANAAALTEIIKAKHCAAYYVPSVPMLGRCIPNVAAAASIFGLGNETLTSLAGVNITGSDLSAGSEIVQAYLNAQDIAMKIFSDFASSWQWIIAGVCFAMILSFIWIVLMRWFTRPIVWICIFSIGGIIAFGIYYTYTEWQRLVTVDGANRSLISVGFTTNLDQYLALTDTWLGFFMTLCVLGGIYFLLLIFLRKRIQIAIKIIMVSSKAVSSMISTLFYPLVTFYLLVVVIVFWGATELFLASAGDPVYKVINTDTDNATKEELDNTACDADEWNNIAHAYYNDTNITCNFIGYGGDSVFQQNRFWLQIGIVFVFFWLVNWVLALGQCTLAGAYASYYWAWDKSRDVPAFPLFSAFGRTLRYHTGSLAFGSFLVALIQFIRAILEYLDHKLRGSENAVAKFFICVCKCCCWCLEKILKFVNRNAYIMIAIYGRNFCSSAGHALKLIIANMVRVVVVDKITDFILFLGKMLIAASLVALSWAFFSNQISFSSVAPVPNLNYYWMPIIIIGIASYMVASAFFNTFGIAVDTVFLCFLEDLERNDGSEENPYYMSKGLMEVLGKKNIRPKDDGKKSK